METSNSVANCRKEKRLADQLDRLDLILDGFGEALTEAVAHAVKEGVAAVVTQLGYQPDHCRPAEIGDSADYSQPGEIG